MESRMTVAMRAIQSATAREAIAPEDVALLRAWASPENRNKEPDELACLVIEVVLIRRKNYKARAAAG